MSLRSIPLLMNNYSFKSLFVLIFACFALMGKATSFYPADSLPLGFKDLKIRNIGPAGMSGRITAIDVDLSNTSRIFAGAASGGVWLSSDGGTSWKPVFDQQNTLSIGSIKINQKNPAEVWVGTGEGNPRNSVNTGRGIFKSIDGGITWQNMGLEETKTIHRIIIDAFDGNTVYAGALGSPWGPNSERGVFKTTDGGKTWTKSLFVDNNTGAADLVVDPTNPRKLIAAMWEHGRKPWTFNSGGKGSGIYITFDGGDHWKKLTEKDGLPSGDLGRVGLAFAPSSPNIVYALIEAKTNALYKSEDGGNTWKMVSDKNIGNRPFYYAEIYVDPKNENRIYNLWSYVSKSEDGGKTFETIMDYGNNVHPDHHAFWIHPEDPSFLIDGNDGGLYISRDKAKSWMFASNIPVGQFYHINVDYDFPYNVYGGMQDNGSWVGPSSKLANGGIRNHDFQEVQFGDGFDIAPYPLNSRYGYSMSQEGYLMYFDRLTGNNRFIQPVTTDSTKLRYNWNAALAVDPIRADGVYFGSQFLYHSTTNGEMWEKLSPDLTTNDPEKQKQKESGGLTIDATGAENHCTIISIGPSPADENVIWVGTDDGNLQVTKDRGKTWTNVISNIKSAPSKAWIPFIEVSKVNPGEAFVVVNNYRQNDYKPYAYHTEDYGQTWRRIADQSQVDGFVLCVVQHPCTPNLLFMGTDAGLYVSFDKGNSWEYVQSNMPKVQIADLKIHDAENDLAIATFGRSFWILDDLSLFEARAANPTLFSKQFFAVHGQTGYLTTNRAAAGERFLGQDDFIGDNRSWHKIDFKVWYSAKEGKKKEVVEEKDPAGKKKKKKEEVAPKPDLVMPMDSIAKDSVKTDNKSGKLKVSIISAEGDTVRTLTSHITEGINKITWNLESDGIKMPSRRRQSRDDDDLPAGIDVLPGDYSVVFQYKNFIDSVRAVVRMDPRQSVSARQLKLKQEDYEAFTKEISELNGEFDKLRKARESIRIVEALITHQADSIKKEVGMLNTKMQSKIDSIEIAYFGQSEGKGYLDNSDCISAKIDFALTYYYGRLFKSGPNADRAREIAVNEVIKAKKMVNDFMNVHWSSYKQRVSKLETKIFNETD